MTTDDHRRGQLGGTEMGAQEEVRRLQRILESTMAEMAQSKALADRIESERKAEPESV